MDQTPVATPRLGLCLALLVIGLLPSAASAELPEAVQRVLTALEIPPEDVSILVRRLDASEPMLSHFPEVPRNPASVMKLVTTWSGLELLGPAYTWPTEVSFGGEVEAIRPPEK